MDADPITGVPIYSANDESTNGGDPWFQFGGTSLAAPMFAAVIALAQQNLVDANLPILNSVGINNDLYKAYVDHYSTYFHDIVLGNNNAIDEGRFGGINITGFNAATGYDLATGIGSPIGNEIVSLLSTPPPG
jgi:subtilase family serine protease